VTTLVSALLVALGGALGALARSGADALATRLGVAAPLGTLAINVVGSFAAGLVATLITDRMLLPEPARPFILVGLLGGFTTFSALALQLTRMGEGGELLALIVYAAGSILLGVAAAAAGVALARGL
jgi:fluoride exporter